MKNTARIWTICRVGVIALIILTFTPIVTPVGTYMPRLLGLPYTLWMGMVVALIIIGLTWIATLAHPGRDDDQ